MSAPRIDVLNDAVLDLLSAWGTPYSWGAGQASVSGWPVGVRGLKGGIGYDCSGFAQAALVRLKILTGKERDRTAHDLYTDCLVIPETEAKLGDLAFYGKHERVTHVMVYLGNGAVIGASGGTSRTNGDDPAAYVQVHRVRYRADFRALGTLAPG